MTSAFLFCNSNLFALFGLYFTSKTKKARISTCGLLVLLEARTRFLQSIAELHFSVSSLGQSHADRQRVRVHGL